MDEDVGQGNAIQVVVKKSSRSSRDDEEEMSSSRPGIRWRNVGGIKDKLLEKLTAAAVPADAFDNARHFLETVVRDVTLAAHGLTMDAFNRIKSHLSDFLPSLSPALANKMVEDADQEAAKEEEEGHNDNDDRLQQNKNKGPQQQESVNGNNNKSASFMFPTSSLFASLVKPRSRL